MKYDPEIKKILDRLVGEVMQGEEGQGGDAQYSKSYPKRI